MKILKHGTTLKKRKLRGTCSECGCKVECSLAETKELFDRDTMSGGATRHVKCPECGEEYLWVT